jgi:hypothetical protein
MKKLTFLLILVSLLSTQTMAQRMSSLLIGDFNQNGDFVPMRTKKNYVVPLDIDNLKFTKLRISDKELMLSYKVISEGKGAIRFFNAKKGEWINIMTVNCCTQPSKAYFLIYDGKLFNQVSDVIVFYAESFTDTTYTEATERHLQIIKFLPDASFRKYDVPLNPKNKFPHKVIVARWNMREQFGEFEDKFKEYSLESRVVSSY